MATRRRQWITGTVVLLVLLVAIVVPAWPDTPATTNPFRGRKLYVDPSNPALAQANAWQRSRPADAAMMRHIAQQSQGIWLGEWDRDIRGDVDNKTSLITNAGALPVFIAYDIPYRDCGSYSAGGAGGADAYRRWIINLARGLNGRNAVVILEPDGLSGLDCLPLRLKDERYVLIREAVKALTAANAFVYIDAGNSNWQKAAEMADRLKKAGIDEAQGFSLNVSNFYSTQSNVAYGDQVSRLVGGKHYVIDTSRNGAGASVGKDWCNPKNQALGADPTGDTRVPLADAYLWLKTPGESDGPCNGGPKAGAWWADYALELSKMADVLAKTIAR